MKIIRRRFDNWSDKTKRRLKCATLPGGYLRHFILAFPQSPTIVVFAIKQVMGWAFVLRNTHNNTVCINLFVNERYRRRGLAVLLIEEALKDFRTISLAKWDTTTRQLFRMLQRRHPDRITVFDWWKNKHRYEEIVQKALLS